MKKALWDKNYTSLIISNSLVTIAFVMLTSTLPLYVQEHGGNNSDAGSMAAVFGIVFLILKPLIGSFIDRTNMLRFLKISIVLYAINCAFYGITASIPFIFALRIVNALTNALFIISCSALVAAILDADQLEDGIAYYRVTSSITVAIAPTIASRLYMAGGFPLMIKAMTVMSVIAFMALFYFDEDRSPAPHKESPLSVKETLRIRNLVEFAALPPCFLALFTYIAAASTGNYLIAFGNSRSLPEVSYFFAVSCVFMIIARLLQKGLSRRTNESMAAATGTILAAAGFFMIAGADSLPFILLAGALYGLGDGLVTPLLNSIAVKRAPKERKGAATATFSLFNGIGSSLGAGIWGKVSYAYGYGAIFRGASFSCLLAAALSFLILSRRKIE